METMIKNNFYEFGNKYNIFSISQHGFLPGRSTCTQLLESNYNWCRALDAGDKVDVVFVDLRKASDVVPHDKLIAKLEVFDVCCKTLRRIRAFLKDRKQTVRFNGKISNINSVVSGMVQGSILGPLLFKYVNDLPTTRLECIIKLYADDSKAYKIINHPSDRILLQLSLDKLGILAELWELDLSYDKCFYLQIGYKDESLCRTKRKGCIFRRD